MPRRKDILDSRRRKIDLSCEDGFEDRVQPAELFDTSARLGENLERLLQLAEPAQEALIAAIGDYCDRQEGVSYFDPGTKNFESAVRKAYNTYGGDNRIRQLTDVYRASIVFNNPDSAAREQLKQDIFGLLTGAGFELVSVRDSFETAPWSDGYRDINIRIKYRNGLIGELQINQCSIKNFTEFLGDKSYEIIGNMWHGIWAGGTTKTIKEIVYECLNKLTTHVYDQKVKENETRITPPSADLSGQEIDLHAPPMARWPDVVILDDGMRSLHLLEAKVNDEAHTPFHDDAEVGELDLMREQSQSPMIQPLYAQTPSGSADIEAEELERVMRKEAAGMRTTAEPPPVVQKVYGRRSGNNGGGRRLRQKRKITKKRRGGNKRRNTKRRQSKKSRMRR